MKKINYIYIIILILLLKGCKEEGLEVYDESKSGSSVYFSSPYATANTVIPADSVHLRFGFLPLDLESSEARVQVSITGPIFDVDRTFKIKVDPNASLKENVHYTFSEGSLIVPAGKNHGFINLNVRKTEEMKQSRLFTSFQLVSNENFNTDLNYRWTTNMQRKVPILDFKVVVDNIFEEPYLWINRRSFVEAYVGKFSIAKLNLIIDLFDEDMKHFTEPSYTDANYFTTAMIIYWGSYLKFWLGKEASEGRVHLDENKQVITAGPSAN